MAHDDFLVALSLKPLSDSCSPQEFTTRVNIALKDHIPFLSRPFINDGTLGKWIVDQLPSDLGADGRALVKNAPVDDLRYGHKMADLFIFIESSAHRPDV